MPAAMSTRAYRATHQSALRGAGRALLRANTSAPNPAPVNHCLSSWTVMHDASTGGCAAADPPTARAPPPLPPLPSPPREPRLARISTRRSLLHGDAACSGTAAAPGGVAASAAAFPPLPLSTASLLSLPMPPCMFPASLLAPGTAWRGADTLRRRLRPESSSWRAAPSPSACAPAQPLLGPAPPPAAPAAVSAEAYIGGAVACPDGPAARPGIGALQPATGHMRAGGCAGCPPNLASGQRCPRGCCCCCGGGGGSCCCCRGCWRDVSSTRNVSSSACGQPATRAAHSKGCCEWGGWLVPQHSFFIMFQSQVLVGGMKHQPRRK
eukprot:351952-Chlamydomonas_euryale.AAC.1